MTSAATAPALTAHGYSGTPLPRKLGLKDGQAAAFLALPDSQAALRTAADFASLRCLGADRAAELPPLSQDSLHLFCRERATLAEALPRLRRAMKANGQIWISWPKKASKEASDITEDVVRALAKAHELVDVKVCAIDATWSGLKLVIPKTARARHREG